MAYSTLPPTGHLRAAGLALALAAAAAGLAQADVRVSDLAGEATRAARVYRDLGYKASIPLFEADADLSVGQMRQLATAYRLNHDTENAERWYAQVVAADAGDPLDLYFYAQALQSNGRGRMAKAYFERYDAARATPGDARGRDAAEVIGRGGVRHADGVTVRNERAVNTEHLDFSPTIAPACAGRPEGIVFVTTRPVGRPGRNGRDLWIDDNFMSLFRAEVDAGAPGSPLAAPTEFAPGLNTLYHEGPLCFDAAGQRMYFTRNTFLKGRRRAGRDGVMRLNLYVSARTADGAWGDPVELPFNTDDYEEAHPALSSDGLTLVFASDRPGGYGGMDLYRADFLGGRWSQPVNLGEAVNTPGNEAFPFVHADGAVYFASDGRGGLGGLDLFVLPAGGLLPALSLDSTLVASGPLAASARVRNLGTPFNSPKDDFGFVVDRERRRGYFSSAREGGLGGDDVYSFEVAAPLPEPALHRVCVYAEPDASRLLPGAEVIVQELGGVIAAGADALAGAGDFALRLRPSAQADGTYDLAVVPAATRGEAAAAPLRRVVGEALRYRTDATGAVAFPALPGRSYRVTAAAEGFVEGAVDVTIPARAADGAVESCVGLASAPTLGLEGASAVSLRGVTVNRRYGNPLPNVDLVLVDLCTGQERTARSAADGSYTFGCVPCGCEYLLRGSKRFFADVEGLASTLLPDCASVSCDGGDEVAVPLALEPAIPGRRAELPAADRAPEALGGQALAEGTVIELHNVYYDFDEAYIRRDAREELDHVVELLRNHPGMEIELGSHTDARGGQTYNRNLSRRRAEAARAYIVSRGIDNRRVTAAGYGESQPRNRCRDGVRDCDESEHQANRRTEVKVTRLGTEGVSVRYNGDLPDYIDRAPAGRRR